MANKTIDHLTVQVGVTPYEHEGNSYDALRVSVMYQKGYGFYVSWMPVKVTEFGYQTGCLSSQDPLEGGGKAFVERVPKNNAKRLETMHAALQLASEGIALYFDLRLWTQMNDFIRYVCLYGFTEHYRQQVENLKAKANINSNKSEDKSMKTNENNIETKNVQNAAQVSNVNTGVDVPEVDDIVPVVTKKKVAQAMVQTANGGPATTMPLDRHGTLVIAGVGGTKADSGSKTEDVHQPSAISHQPSTKVQDSVPQEQLTYQTYEKTKVNKTTKKEYTVTHAKIMGFAATDEAYQRGVELHGAVSGEMVDGAKVLGLYFSHRYAAAAKLVCDALNAGKPFAECVAIIDNATEENAKKREEWKAKIEERKAAREAKRAGKTNTNRTNDTNQPTAGYSAQDVAAMLQKVLAGGELPKDVEALMKKAA